MNILTKRVVVKLSILFALVLVQGLLVFQPKALASPGCQTCVFPDPGSMICVACSESDNGQAGFTSCTPNSEACTCTVGGGSCVGGMN